MNEPWKTKIPERTRISFRKGRPLPLCLLPALGLAALSILPGRAASPNDSSEDIPSIELFFQAGALEEADAKPALEAISRSWRDAYTAMLVELGGPTYPEIKTRLFRFLGKQTGQFFGEDSQRWLRWVWKQPYQPHPEYLIYNRYFATESLMFQVAERDRRLRNKAEILGIVLSPYSPDAKEQPLAISSRFLKKKPVFRTELAGHSLTILTTRAGANRVFKTGKERFQRLLRDDRVVDAGGKTWKMTEDGLVSEAGPGRVLPRIPAYRAFWFGWFAQYPETRLIK